MKKEDCKVGMYVSFKADYEVSGKIIRIDNDGWCDIQGPDEETSDGMYNVHCSYLTEEK